MTSSSSADGSVAAPATAQAASEDGLLAAFAVRVHDLSFFADFDELAWAELLPLARWRDFAAGDVLLRAGETGDSFCVLLTGQARVYRAGRAIGELGAGDCCGEMAWLRPHGEQRVADIVATSEGALLEISVAALASASCRLRSLIDRAFLDLLLDRLQQADSGLASMSL